MTASITTAGLSILRTLSEFHFLTTPQMVRLGLVSHTNTASNLLRGLRERKRPLVYSTSYSGTEMNADGKPSFGRKPSLHQLSPHGAALLADHERISVESIPHAKRPTRMGQDYHHLVATLDVHIACILFCQETGATLAGAWRYFVKKGAPGRSSLNAETAVPIENAALPRQRRYEPDLILQIIDPKDITHLFVVEVHRGQDKARLLRTLEHNRCLLGQGQPQLTLGIHVPSVCIALCEHPPLAERACSELQNDLGFTYERDRFAFGTLKTPFLREPLVFADGQRRSIFTISQ